MTPSVSRVKEFNHRNVVMSSRRLRDSLPYVSHDQAQLVIARDSLRVTLNFFGGEGENG